MRRRRARGREEGVRRRWRTSAPFSWSTAFFRLWMLPSPSRHESMSPATQRARRTCGARGERWGLSRKPGALAGKAGGATGVWAPQGAPRRLPRLWLPPRCYCSLLVCEGLLELPASAPGDEGNSAQSDSSPLCGKVATQTRGRQHLPNNCAYDLSRRWTSRPERAGTEAPETASRALRA